MSKDLLLSQLIKKSKHISKLSPECSKILSIPTLKEHLISIIEKLSEEQIETYISLNEKDKVILKLLTDLPPVILKYSILDKLNLRDMIRLKYVLRDNIDIPMFYTLDYFQNLLINNSLRSYFNQGDQDSVDYDGIWNCMLFKDTPGIWYYIKNNHLIYKFKPIRSYGVTIGEHLENSKRDFLTMIVLSEVTWDTFIKSHWLQDDLEEVGLEWTFPPKPKHNSKIIHFNRCSDLYENIYLELYTKQNKRYLLLICMIDYGEHRNYNIIIYEETNKLI